MLWAKYRENLLGVGSREVIMSPGVPQRAAAAGVTLQVFQPCFPGAESRASATGGRGQGLPEGSLLGSWRSWFNWRCQLLNEAKGKNPFEELFFLSLSVSLHWLYFAQF